MPAGVVATTLLEGTVVRCLCSRQKSAGALSSPPGPPGHAPSGTTQSIGAVGAFPRRPISPEFHFWVAVAGVCVCRGVGGWGVSLFRGLWGHQQGSVWHRRCGASSGRLLMCTINPGETGEVRAGRQEQQSAAGRAAPSLEESPGAPY